MAEYKLTVLKPSAVEACWPELAAMLHPGVQFANGEFDTEDLLTMVRQNRAFVAVMSEGDEVQLAVVFEVLEYPRKRVLHVLVMGGRNFGTVLTHCGDSLNELAQRVGAVAIRGAVRPSMERYCQRVAPEAKRIYAVLEWPVGGEL